VTNGAYIQSQPHKDDQQELLPTELALMVSQAIFNIACLLEATFHQRLYPRLAGGTPRSCRPRPLRHPTFGRRRSY